MECVDEEGNTYVGPCVMPKFDLKIDANIERPMVYRLGDPQPYCNHTCWVCSLKKKCTQSIFFEGEKNENNNKKTR